MAGAIVLIDYGSGNQRSAEKALVAALGVRDERIVVSSADPDVVASADRLVLPGVGAFRACMTAITACDGLREAMEHAVRVRAAPFLGVCVGMQLLASRGLEFGAHDGLGWIPGEVRELDTGDATAKVPHTGWNRLRAESPHALIRDADEDMYFTHSYAFEPEDQASVIASVDHGRRFAAAVARDNIAGVQFHPEKSQTAGLALIHRFLEWRP